MKRRDIVLAVGLELGVVALYGVGLWLLTHPDSLALLKPRVYRAIAVTSSKGANILGQVSIKAGLAYSQSVEALRP